MILMMQIFDVEANEIKCYECNELEFSFYLYRYKCDVCDYFSFYPGALAEHKAIHTGMAMLSHFVYSGKRLLGPRH